MVVTACYMSSTDFSSYQGASARLQDIQGRSGRADMSVTVINSLRINIQWRVLVCFKVSSNPSYPDKKLHYTTCLTVN